MIHNFLASFCAQIHKHCANVELHVLQPIKINFVNYHDIHSYFGWQSLTTSKKDIKLLFAILLYNNIEMSRQEDEAMLDENMEQEEPHPPYPPPPPTPAPLPPKMPPPTPAQTVWQQTTTGKPLQCHQHASRPLVTKWPYTLMAKGEEVGGVEVGSVNKCCELTLIHFNVCSFILQSKNIHTEYLYPLSNLPKLSLTHLIL